MASALPTVNDCCTECSGVSVTVTTTSSAQNLFVYNTIAEFRSGASPTTDTAMAILNGYTTAYDGLGGGVYTFQSGSTATDNDVSVIKPNDTDASDPGRWIKNI